MINQNCIEEELKLVLSDFAKSNLNLTDLSCKLLNLLGYSEYMISNQKTNNITFIPNKQLRFELSEEYALLFNKELRLSESFFDKFSFIVIKLKGKYYKESLIDEIALEVTKQLQNSTYIIIQAGDFLYFNIALYEQNRSKIIKKEVIIHKIAYNSEIKKILNFRFAKVFVQNQEPNKNIVDNKAAKQNYKEKLCINKLPEIYYKKIDKIFDGEILELLKTYNFKNIGLFVNQFPNILINDDKLMENPKSFEYIDKITEKLSSIGINNCPIELSNFQKEDLSKITIDELLNKNFLKELIDKINQAINKLSLIYREILSMRYGLIDNKILTLEEIGQKKNLTRERIRQIQKKSILKINKFLIAFLENFNNEIKQIFTARGNFFITTISNEAIFYKNIINTILENNNNICFEFNFDIGLVLKKDTNIEDLLDDEFVDIKTKEKIEKFLFKDYIIVDNHRVKNDKSSILDFFIKFYCKTSIKFNDFQNIYMDFLINNNLNNRLDLLYDDTTLYNKLANSKSMLLSPGKILRHYAQDSAQSLINKLHIEQYKNIEISSRKIFNDNVELMKAYDIQNEYELHNLLKKNIKNDEIGFARMPTIRFGKTDKKEQVINILKQLSPIKYIDLAKAYEEEYGVDINTFCANYLNSINKYLVNGYYEIETEELHSEYLEKLKCLLDKDFYWKDELEIICKPLLNGKSTQNLNIRNLKKLNFSVTSKCIYSDKYDSLADYIKTYLTNNDIIDLRKDNRLRTIQIFYQVFSDMKNNLDLIEFSPDLYINIKKLNTIGITKEDLLDYQNKVRSIISDKYFTIFSLRNMGFEFPKLDDLGFDDYFYESILMNDSDIKSRKINNEYLLQYSTKTFELSDFITYLMGSLREIDICDFSNYIESKYGLKINRYQIASATKECELYYNRIMEKVYIDYEEYYNGF